MPNLIDQLFSAYVGNSTNPVYFENGFPKVCTKLYRHRLVFSYGGVGSITGNYKFYLTFYNYENTTISKAKICQFFQGERVFGYYEANYGGSQAITSRSGFCAWLIPSSPSTSEKAIAIYESHNQGSSSTDFGVNDTSASITVNGCSVSDNIDIVEDIAW